MFLFSKPKGKTPQNLFHGGCHGCELQHAHGTTKCSGCCYFKADWNKPNLNTLDKKMKLWNMRVKFFALFGISPLVEKPMKIGIQSWTIGNHL